MFSLADLVVTISVDSSNLRAGLYGAMSLVEGFFKHAVIGAADFEETINKVQIMFGGAASTIINHADKLAESFHVPKMAMLDASAIFGKMGQAAGMSALRSADFAVAMADLAMDLKSVHNVPMEEAFRKIESGLAGNVRPLREYGIMLSQMAVQQEAVNLGIAKQGEHLTDAQKIQARASLIMQQTTKEQGDMARTYGSAKNQYDAFWSGLQNLMIEVGGVFTEAFGEMATAANSALNDLTQFFRDNKETIKGWIQTVTTIVLNADVIWANFKDNIQIALLKAAQAWDWFTSSLSRGAGIAGNYMLKPAETLVQGFSFALETVGKIWDRFIEILAYGMDVMLRPIRDLTNAMGLTHRSMEEQVLSLKGAFDMPAEGARKFEGYIAGLREELSKMGGASQDAKAIADQIQRLEDQIKARKIRGRKPPEEKSIYQLLAESAERTEGWGEIGGAEAAPGKRKKAESIGVAEFATKLRLEMGGPDIPQKQLSELQQIREQDKKNGEMLSRMLDQKFIAVLG